MDRRRFSLSMMSAAALAGCGGGGGSHGVAFAPIVGAPPAPPPAPADPPAVDPGPPPPTEPQWATPTALPARTVFQQCIASDDDLQTTPLYGEPNHPNTWDLYLNFGLDDGGDDQFDRALGMRVDFAGDTFVFPINQTYAELTALGPEMGPEEGVRGVSFTGDPRHTYSNARGAYAFLHAGPTVRLQQTLDLGTATGSVALTWTGLANIDVRSSIESPLTTFEVAVRDTSGKLLASLFRVDESGTSGTWGAASLTAFAGQVVVLSFEQLALVRGSVIDSVSVKDAGGAEFIGNGDFEAGEAAWTVSTGKVARNVRSGARTLGALQVQRTFYTQPNLPWGRFTDEFHNPGAAPVDATVIYDSVLGSGGFGVIYPTPGAVDKGLTTWDAHTGSRDAGLVFGHMDAVDYRSTTATDTASGAEAIQFSKSVTVPPGATVTLINFIVLGGTDTGLTATDIGARAMGVDTVAADIAHNFRTDVLFQRGLTRAQVDTVKNF